ncbi:hypothetical protein LCGC14_1083900 [marine sediment metagenome]|uniref:Uncharacterized protein n=1 Tax=marine sediment metagenome TaxID=412755 RepID=A0A0F9MJ19_9ZZZZ
MKEILEHWNSYKEKGSGWQGQRAIDYTLETLIKEEFSRGWTAQDIMDAISVFAMIFFEDRYYWSYGGWNLTTWLKRLDRDNKKLKRWYSWHPNNFVEEVWLSHDFKDAQTKQITKEELYERQKEHYREQYEEYIKDLDTLKKSVLWNLPGCRELIEELKGTEK